MSNSIPLAASQQHAVDASLNPRSYNDLSHAQKLLFDDFIKLLSDVNSNEETLTDATREGLWNRVFRNWDASRNCFKPEPLGARSMNDTRFPVGELIQDCPLPRQRKKNSDGTLVVPVHRRAGATVWLTARIFDNKLPNVRMIFLDKNNSPVERSLVSLYIHYNEITAKAEAIDKYDANELARVGQWNRELVVYFARVRLIWHQRERKEAGGAGSDAIQVTDADGFPAAETIGDQCAKELLQIRCCREAFKLFVEVCAQFDEGNTGPLSTEHLLASI